MLVRLFLMMHFLIVFMAFSPMTGHCQKTFDIVAILNDALKPYVATAHLNIQMCEENHICRGLAEEYINSYYLINKQCANVLEEDRVLCEKFKTDCSSFSGKEKESCEVYMRGDIGQAQAMGLDRDWYFIEDMIVDMALVQGYLVRDINACWALTQQYIDPSKSQYYACDIVFAQDVESKTAEIVQILLSKRNLEEERALCGDPAPEAIEEEDDWLEDEAGFELEEVMIEDAL